MTSETVPKRGRGRPVQTDQERELVRTRILVATEQVLARHVYRDVTVQRILEAGSLARATFYRYFDNAEAAVDAVLQRFVGDLVTTLAGALAPLGPDGAMRVVTGVDVYLEWSRRYRHLLPSFMADAHDPTSPVSKVRSLGVDAVIDVLGGEFAATGRVVPDRDVLDIFITTVEYTCMRLYLDSDGGAQATTRARNLMLRIAVAMLGSPARMQRLAETTQLS